MTAMHTPLALAIGLTATVLLSACVVVPIPLGSTTVQQTGPAPTPRPATQPARNPTPAPAPSPAPRPTSCTNGGQPPLCIVRPDRDDDDDDDDPWN